MPKKLLIIFWVAWRLLCHDAVPMTDLETHLTKKNFEKVVNALCNVADECIEGFDQMTGGPFPTLRPIGFGSFGQVYSYTPKDVLKVIPVGSDFHLSGTMREVNVGLMAKQGALRKVAPLENCCFDKGKDFEKQGRRVFLHMKRYQSDLRQFMLKSNNDKITFTPLWKYSVIKDIVDGVYSLHQHNLVHRDLKPANILMEDDNHAHITDFGQVALIPKDTQVIITREETGTPGYVSPEGIPNGPILPANIVSKAYDIYSLGVIIFEVMVAASYALDPTQFSGTYISYCMNMPDMRDIKNWENEFYCRVMHDLVGQMTLVEHSKRPSIEAVREFIRTKKTEFSQAQKSLQEARKILEYISPSMPSEGAAMQGGAALLMPTYSHLFI